MGVFATSATDSTPKWSGVYYNDVPVMSACHCHRMCISHLEEGCKSWKFYLEANAGIKHCYLQSSIFGPGEGYYGKTEATWAGWTSGTPQYRYYKDSFPMAKQLASDRPWLLGVTVDDATKLASGEPFKLSFTNSFTNILSTVSPVSRTFSSVGSSSDFFTDCLTF